MDSFSRLVAVFDATPESLLGYPLLEITNALPFTLRALKKKACWISLVVMGEVASREVLFKDLRDTNDHLAGHGNPPRYC